MSLLSILRPAPHVDEIQDEELMRKQYRHWRIRIFYGMYIGYVFYYISRKSLTFAMPTLMTDLGFTKSDMGILASLMSITYGLSKFLSGVLADRSNPRYFMSFGLIITGVANLLFGLGSSIMWFALFWAVNGWFQGWGWPPCARQLTHWYSQKERGTWWGIWNTSHSLGLAAIAMLGAIIATYYGWRMAMYIPGVLCILAGLFLINRMRDTPQSLGLPPIEKFRNDYPATSIKADEKELTTKEILFTYILKNKFIWLLACSYFFVYLIRQAMNDWGMLYLCESKGYSQIFAGTCIVSFEAGGFFGSLVAGWASDYVFSGKRCPIIVIFSFAVAAALACMWLSPYTVGWVDSALMFVVGFLIYGPQMLIGMAAAEISHKKAAGSATGFIGWIAYLGAAFAGYPLSVVTQNWGWQAFFAVLGVSGVIAAFLLVPLWSVKVNPKYAKKESEDGEPSQA